MSMELCHHVNSKPVALQGLLHEKAIYHETNARRQVCKESCTATADIIGCDGLKATLADFVVYEKYVY